MNLPKAATRSGRARDERGTAMIELLIALAVFVVGVVSLAQLFTVAIRTGSFGNTTGQATLLASGKIEELRALDFSSAALAPGGSLADSVAGYSDEDPSGNFVRRWAIYDQTAAAPNTAPSTHVRVIIVRVEPKLADKMSAKPVQLQSLMNDPK